MSRVSPWIDRAGPAVLLLLPLFLTHGRGLAEADIDIIAILFLARCAMRRDWAWLRHGWVGWAGLWWAWLVICSVPGVPGLGAGGGRSLLQAVLVARLLLFVAALEGWLLRDSGLRRRLMAVIRLMALYIAAQEALQFFTGRNLFGYPRQPSGELTGPYDEARAGPVMSRLLLPCLLPPVWRWWSGQDEQGRQERPRRWLASAMVLGGIASIVLFGQRMPALLTGLGLVVSAMLLPRLRLLVLGGCVAGVALLGATAVVVPPTFNRMVVRFSQQMRHWPESPYGELSARAAAIGEAMPLTGGGFDSFRILCERPAYWHDWAGVLRGDQGFRPAPEPPHTDMPAVWRWYHAYGGAFASCAQHPHNHYFQALVESGVPGLVLFCAMILAWLAPLGRGLWRRPDALRVGLFAAALIQEWPVASSSDFVNLPLGGWFLLLLGLGLAEARWPRPAASPISASATPGGQA